jgi:hypothetical protein
MEPSLCECDQKFDILIQYVTESKLHNMSVMNNTDNYEYFFFFKGKVMAYNELLRFLEKIEEPIE